MPSYRGIEINTKATEAMANAAKRGLRLRKEHGRGGTRVGVTRANQIARRDTLTFETIKRMRSFFARHEVDLQAPKNKDPKAPGYPGAGLIAWLLWGGNPGQKFAERIVKRMNTIDEQKNGMTTESKVWAVHPLYVEKAATTLFTEADYKWDDEDEMKRSIYTLEGVEVIPIHGVIGHKISASAKAAGASDVVDIIEQVEAAASDDSISTIVLDVDSPGGTVGGIPELAETIEDVQRGGRKTIIAYTDGMMASAAYWAVAGANAIYASPSSEVGSIGVYMPVMDTSAALRDKGISVELIKAGKYKGAGFPGVAIDEEVRSFLQAEVNETYDDFVAFVSKYRPALGGDKMQGQTFSGKRAAQIGMIDGVKKNLKNALEMF